MASIDPGRMAWTGPTWAIPRNQAQGGEMVHQAPGRPSVETFPRLCLVCWAACCALQRQGRFAVCAELGLGIRHPALLAMEFDRF